MATMLHQTKQALDNSHKLNDNLRKYELENQVNIYDIHTEEDTDDYVEKGG